MAGRRQAFQNNPELQRFVLHGVRPTGRQLGVGSYGSVEELQVNGLLCAGKRIHEALLEQGNAGVENIARKYLLECQVMAEMRHPHIVQFLGVCFLEGSTLPVLVMERLDSSLDDLLETSPSLPFSLKQSLLADVARGLLYLHTRNPPIVHRDLSARNVLLTSSLVAKISDLGNVRIVDLQSGQLARTLTRLPGTLSYMPPESYDGGSQYGPRLDIFSFGHLALFTLTQVFPGNLLPPNYPDPDNSDRLVGRSEVERRTDYIQPLYKELGEQHPLVQLVCQCLRNVPAQRPSAEELLQQLEAQMKEAYGRKLVRAEMARLQVAMMAMFKTEETDTREKESEIKHLQHDLQQVQEDRERLKAEVEAKDAEMNRQQGQLQTLTEGKGRLQAEVEAGLVQVQEKDAEINKLQRELQTLKEDRERLKAEVEVKDAEIDRQQGQLQTLTEDKGRLQAEIDARVGQVQEKDTEIKKLQRELQTLRNDLQNIPQDGEDLSKRVKSLETELICVQGELLCYQKICEGYESRLDCVVELDDKKKMMERPRAGKKKFKAGIMHRHTEETKEEMKTMIESFQAIKREGFTEAEHKAQREGDSEPKVLHNCCYMDAGIAQFQQQLHEKDGEINKLERELQTLRAEMDARSAQLRQELKEKDGEIKGLQTEQRAQTTSGEEHVAAMQSPTQKPQVPLQQWYFGPIKQADAEKLLLQDGNSTGTFLIRESDSQPDNSSLSVQDGNRVHHYLIKKTDTGGYYVASRCIFKSLEELVKHYSGDADGLCCQLTVACPNFETPSTTGVLHNAKGVWEIERSSVQLKKRLGARQFGEVWEGIWNGTPATVNTLETKIVEMQDFLAKLQKLQHDNLLQLYGVCTDGEPVYIVTEFMNNGSLPKYLQSDEGRRLKLAELINIAAQVASGMAYLEAQHLIHRDLGARNILVGEGNIVKIAGFIMTCIVTDEDTTEQRKLLYAKWTAPEAFLYNRFSIKSDVWSYGIFIWELITYGQRPYPGMPNKEVPAKVEQGYRMPRPFGCPDSLYQIMRDCWKENPEERPTFEYLKHHMENYFVATEQTYILK